MVDNDIRFAPPTLAAQFSMELGLLEIVSKSNPMRNFANRFMTALQSKKHTVSNILNHWTRI